MRLITLLLILCLAAVQYPLWFGSGGWLHAQQMEGELQAAETTNKTLTSRNAKLANEVEDLKNAGQSLEEAARTGLGYVKDDEIFLQIVDNRDLVITPEVAAAQKAAAAKVAAAKAAAEKSTEHD